MGAYLLKFMRWCWGGFWAGMIKGTPGAKLVRFLPWFVPEMTRYVVQVAEREVSHRLLTSGPAVTFFPADVCSRTPHHVYKLQFHNIVLEDNMRIFSSNYKTLKSY